MAENGLKRPHPNDDLRNADNAQKRIRSNNGSPAPQTNETAGTKPDVSKIVADARARAAAVAARLQGSRTHGLSPTSQSSSPGPTGSTITSGMSRAEELRARVAAAIGNKKSTPVNGFAPPLDDGTMGARGGLGTALHPALMDNAGQGLGSSKNKQAIQSKFPTTMANQRVPSPATQISKSGKAKKQLDLSGPSAEETRANPYFDPSLGAQTATLKARHARQLKFNEKGKYIQQAAALRRAANLEAMRKRIQESSKKVLPSEDPGEKNFLIEPPPGIEWWDEGLVTDVKNGYAEVEEHNKIETEDSIITRFIQNPVQIEPPGVKNMPTPKPMYLTSKEQAKLRRQKRMEALKEIQTKERLGLLPTPAPKVKLKNMMMVLGQEAVKDPTAVEARVRKEVKEREDKHLAMNEERKLTKEERHEKLEEKKAKDAAKGIYFTVYKVYSFANRKNRVKVNLNAEQMGLTGLVLYARNQSLVLAEGGEKSIKDFKKLMLNRINWAENDSPNVVKEGNREAQAQFLQNTDEEGNLKDLGENKCELLFEGLQKDRVFRKWGSKIAETDREAVELLGRTKNENFWTLAKSVG